MAPRSASARRKRGRIERLPSGSLRVRVYAGLDPITGKKHHLTEVVPAGPKAAKEAERVRTKLLAAVDERRTSRTNATVNELIDRYLEVLTIEDTTRAGYELLIRNYIRPVLGRLPIGRIDGETLDAFYAELLRCRARCPRRKFVEHHTEGEHACDERCRPHVCNPLKPNTIATSTPSSAAPTPARSAGAGSARTRSARHSSPPLSRRIQGPQAPPKRLAS